MKIINLDKNIEITNKSENDFFEIFMFYNNYLKIKLNFEVYNVFESVIFKIGQKNYYVNNIILEMMGDDKKIYLIDPIDLNEIYESDKYEPISVKEFKELKKNLLTNRKKMLNNNFAINDNFSYEKLLMKYLVNDYFLKGKWK